MGKLLELKNLAKNLSVLYVEDETDLRQSVANYLKKLFDTVTVCVDGLDGLEQYKKQKPDIIISDILMPNMNGIEMLTMIKQLHPSQNIIITSAYTESEFFVDSIKLGVGSYIIKPINYDQMVEVLYTMVSKISQENELNLYHCGLEHIIQEKVKEYQSLEYARVEDYEKVLLALVKMIEQRDSYTAGHSQRVATYSKMLAFDLGYDEKACDLIYQAGILHDIGKIATPDAILLKPEHLSSIEYKLIKEHVKAGTDILKEVPMFNKIIDVIGSHHERYDGNGYPLGLKADAIPPLARIMIVADAFDAMTTSRIYRHKKSVKEALVEIKSLSCIQFHPEVVQSASHIFAHLTIEHETSQLPTSQLEEERFVYFYRDSISQLHNQKYLSIVLLKNNYTHFYQHLHIVSLHHFAEYNNHFGWEGGNQLLLSFASMLTEYFSNTLIFRIHANDFILLSEEKLNFENGPIEAFQKILQDNLSFSIHSFDILKEDIDSMEKLETVLVSTKGN
ncbi:MAG: response regulator [Sulfurospirillaceae bacterium]|nr:response regulator [Sulfurospirillaceae bacterium]